MKILVFFLICLPVRLQLQCIVQRKCFLYQQKSKHREKELTHATKNGNKCELINHRTFLLTQICHQRKINGICLGNELLHSNKSFLPYLYFLLIMFLSISIQAVKYKLRENCSCMNFCVTAPFKLRA